MRFTPCQACQRVFAEPIGRGRPAQLCGPECRRAQHALNMRRARARRRAEEQTFCATAAAASIAALTYLAA